MWPRQIATAREKSNTEQSWLARISSKIAEVVSLSGRSLRAVDRAIEEQNEISASVHLAVPDAITPLAVLNFCRASFEEGVEPFFGLGIALRNTCHQGFKKIAGRRPALGNARQRLQQGEIS
jgi:hypothetical protein